MLSCCWGESRRVSFRPGPIDPGELPCPSYRSSQSRTVSGTSASSSSLAWTSLKHCRAYSQRTTAQRMSAGVSAAKPASQSGASSRVAARIPCEMRVPSPVSISCMILQPTDEQCASAWSMSTRFEWRFKKWKSFATRESRESAQLRTSSRAARRALSLRSERPYWITWARRVALKWRTDTFAFLRALNAAIRTSGLMSLIRSTTAVSEWPQMQMFSSAAMRISVDGSVPIRRSSSRMMRSFSSSGS